MFGKLRPPLPTSPPAEERENSVRGRITQGGAPSSLTLGYCLLAPSGRQLDPAGAVWGGRALLHAHQTRVTNEVLLQVRVEGALAA